MPYTHALGYDWLDECTEKESPLAVPKLMGGIRLGWWSLLLCTVLASAPAGAEPSNLKALVQSTQGNELLPEAEPAGNVEKLPDGVRIQVAPGSQVQRAASTNLSLGAPGGATTPTYVYRLQQGRLQVTIPDDRMLKVAVLVIGPQGRSAVVRGGHSLVVARPSFITFAAHGQGMLVGKGSHWRTLEAGRTCTTDLKTGKTEEAAHLQAPELSIDGKLAVALPGSDLEARIQIEPLPRAASYQLALLRQTGSQLSRVTSLETKTPQAHFDVNSPGQYVIVARAVDASGLSSPLSSPMAVRVFGVQLPAGAEVRGQSVLLRPNQRLPLLQAEGLKMTYGQGGYFVDTPKSVGLMRDTATTVRFQDPSTKEEVELLLTPRLLTADVSIGPSSASWPDDRVSINVKLWDGAGRAIAGTRRVRARVSVNLDPVDARWQHHGNSMSSAIKAPPSAPGPWVVRVEVEDETGVVIGRDFLEVVNSPRKFGSKRSVAKR